MEGHDFVGCTTPAPKMTVDELLAKLDAEYGRLEAELPEHFMYYGRFKYDCPTDTGYHHQKNEIDCKTKRQKEIRAIQYQIKQEVERATA